MNTFKIQLAKEADAEAINALILLTATTQLRSEFSDDGWELFLKLINADTQKALIKNKKYNYCVAIETNQYEIVGVLVTKDINHLFHLFIKPSWQGKGVGKKLWLDYLAKIKKHLSSSSLISSSLFSSSLFSKRFDKITVNSSDFAIDFYQSLGFKLVSGRQTKNGICYTPMTYSF